MSTPATIVIFGASGDLTARKLVPALFDNFRKKRLPPDTRIVGVSRTPMSDDQFREKLFGMTQRSLGAVCDEACWADFCSRIHYHAGDVSNADDYPALEDALRKWENGNGAGRLYYLSLKPELYETVIANLGQTGHADQNNGWRRVVVEKPFGHDYASAQSLNEKINAVFDESQVYRIDHYLGKETVQNMLALRFANAIFEPIWNRNYIDHVQITVSEDLPIGSRAGYYDTSGVLRDMFQNHLLQILTLITMEPPSRFDATILRDEKRKVLNSIRTPDPDIVEKFSVLGQYDGYHKEVGVPEASRTPTFAAVRLNIDNWRWQGIPFYLRSGKAMAAKLTEVVIQFVCPPHMIFDVPADKKLQSNQLIITIQPDEGIHIAFQTKVPDQGMKLQRSNLYFHYKDAYPIQGIPDAYERLLLDALNGDASLFIRKDEIESAWRIIDPVIKGWESSADALPQYEIGSWGPVEADVLIELDGKQWINGASLHHDE